MSEGYVLLAGILLYIVMFRIVLTTNLKPFVAALLVIGAYFTLSTSLQAVLLTAYKEPISQLFEPVKIAIVLCQLGLAWFAYTKVAKAEDSYTELLVWGALGCLGVFFFIPMLFYHFL